MRGEYITTVDVLVYQNGSPPHAWGILIAPTVIVALERFTPTCVGNTELLFSPKGDCTVHPHMRGEYGILGRFAYRSAVRPHMRGEYVEKWRSIDRPGGSPPHAWGILAPWVVALDYIRFT